MDLKEISKKRQKKWKETDLYKVREDISKPKFYILAMFPYPSGAWLHVWHPKGYIATDTLARKKMLEGYNVLHPMGFDTFGLWTENYAIEHKMKPQDVAKKNIATYMKQLEMFGTTYDRSRAVNTADPKYFKRTQRVFLQMYNHYYDEKLKKAMPITDPSKQERLAYVDYKPINRCPSCMTGLANEDLDDGKCERCGSVVEQRPMKQRVLRITKYAERLLEWLDTLKREESMKDLERNWIGKSEGTDFTMKVITEENDKAAWMVIEKSIETTAIQELLSFWEVNIEATDPDRWNFYRILVDKKDEKKFIAFLWKNLKTKWNNGEPSSWYADSDWTTNMVVFSGGKIFDTSTDEWCAQARDYGISLGIPEHQVRFSPRTYSPWYKDHSKRFSVYTTRIDTVFWMSFVAIAPEHPLVDKITTKEYLKEVEKYKDAAKHKTQLERTELQKEKTGVFCGAYAINPFNGEKVKIFVADYVLANYGTGVVMAVPAHDERDYEFAKKYKLPIKNSILPKDKKFEEYDKVVSSEICYTEKWLLNNSWEFTGLDSDNAIKKIQARLEKKWIWWVKVNYKMQDRVFSRQRYRGEPFPIVRTEDGEIVALDEKDLPVELPDVDNYQPTGTEEWPLANITDRVNMTLPDGRKAKRETNTMPGRAGSSRYRLRYMDVNNDKALVGKDKEKYRGNVDVYVGGAEHVTRHMIYARFRQKFLYDIGVVTKQEPFEEYHYVGLIMGEDGRKMSKRRKNVVSPDDIINEFWTDALRTYEMFMGPFDQPIAWSTNGIKWVKKFLDKVIALKDKITTWNLEPETLIIVNQTIKKIWEDIDAFRFNTGVSQLMILVNHLIECKTINKKTFEDLVVLMSPFAPHLAEELREQLGNEYSVFTKAKRPKYDEKYLIADTITIGVQVNGKVRWTINISKDAEEKEAFDLAKSDEKINTRITGEPKKVIYVKWKILNIVV